MLEAHELFKDYENQPLLRGVSFQVAQGETICLLGASGSGKSTLLRIIAGLEIPDSGQVLWEGQDLVRIPVHRRGFGLMFQDYALFPHRNVAENVAFGLRMQKLSPAEISQRVQEALENIHMTDFAARRVTDLSGGEQQRVALARALVPRPRLLMLDEPLGALDRALREQLSEELRELLHATRIPAIYVTHDQEEAFTIADRLILLHEGLVIQEGAPQEVYRRPKSVWAAQFLGLTNLLPGKIVQRQPLLMETALGVLQGEPAAEPIPSLGAPVTALLRPWGARVQRVGAAGDNPINGRVVDVVFRPEGFRARLSVAEGLEFQFYLDRAVHAGEMVNLSLPASEVLCL